jgi:hypothetical protein
MGFFPNAAPTPPEPQIPRRPLRRRRLRQELTEAEIVEIEKSIPRRPIKPNQQKPSRLRAAARARQQVIDQMRPLLIKKDQPRFGLKEVLLFAENDRLVLSLVGHHGTVSIPLSRKAAATLAHKLMVGLI